MDPVRTVDEAVALVTEVTTAIPSDVSPLSRCWQGTGLDGLILSPPNHSGRPQEVAREVYHRLSARFIGAQVHKTQTRILTKGIKTCLGGVIGVWVGMPFFAAFVGEHSPSLLKTIPLLYAAPAAWTFWYASSIAAQIRSLVAATSPEKRKEEALGAVRRCFLRAIPPGTPDDLADVWRHGWCTSDGRPVSSEIVDTDATSLAALEVASNWKSIDQSLKLCALISLIPGVPFLVLPILIGMAGRAGSNPGHTRSGELDRRAAVEGAVLASAGGIAWSTHQEKARVDQIAESIKDKTPLFDLGTATGILAARGDHFAPSEGLPFCLSLRDLQNHLLVLGGTGSGKTSGVLRPLAHQVAKLKNVGLVVMDGKAALPGELRSLGGMQIIDPAESQFSLVAGLSPSELIDTIVDVLSTGSESDPFWRNSAAGLLRRAAVLARKFGGKYWTLSGIAEVATDESIRTPLIQSLDLDDIIDTPDLKDAVIFFQKEWAEMEQKVRSGVLGHAMSWVSTITGHPDLLAWANLRDGEDSFNLLAPLHGGRLGFLIPAHRYGRAGSVVTALLKARLYSGIKRRAEAGTPAGETPVVFIIDEAQEVATGDDATMLSIGRSLGLAMVGATQTVEGVTEKLGDKASAKWLAVYGSTIALTGRSSATDEFMARRAGSTWKAQVRSVPGISVRDSMTSSIFSGSIAASRKQPTMKEFASPSPSPLAMFSERARQAAQNQQAMSSDPRHHREPDDGLSSTVEPVALVHPHELSGLLAEPDLALAVTIRARVPRRDVIKLKPKF